MKTIKKPQSNLTNVLALINQGRGALGMAPLREIPKGIIGDPEQCSLARAFGEGVGCDGNACYVPRYTVHLDKAKQAHALAAAYGTTVEKMLHSFAAVLPEELSRFEHELAKGHFPELIDRDCMEMEDAAARLGIETETLADLVAAGLIAAIPKWCYAASSAPSYFIRWSVLESHFPTAGKARSSDRKVAA